MIVRRISAFRGTLRPILLTTALAVTFVAPGKVSADTDLSLGSTAVIAYANGDAVRLRNDFTFNADVIAMVPEGSTVEPLDGPFEAADGSFWYQVSANGKTGYIVSDYLAASSGIYSGTSGSAITTDAVNLRSGPGLGESVLISLGVGETVTMTGENVSGWLSAEYAGTSGYVYGAFLSAGGDSANVSSGATGIRFTDDALNLRSGPSLSEIVLSVLPFGTQVELSGNADGEFVEVSTSSGNGWVAARYLLENSPEANSAPDTLISWPVTGGTWSVLQGYNGSSHQNRTDLWQYRYSLDLVYEDGSTAGQPVYSPVDGEVRWYDESTGGVSIDMGNGYAFAMFHVIFDAGIPEGESVSKGQYLGYIASSGQASNGGTPHLHVTVWETDDGGNWSRRAVPFVGNLSLSGVEFPDGGASYDHTGEIINP